MLRQVTRQLFSNRALIARTPRATFVSEDESEVETIETSGKEPCINSVTLLGRVGTPPELIETGNFISFRLATNSGKYTDWHQINYNALKGQKFVLDNVSVGDRVFVNGRLGYAVKSQIKYPKIYADEVILLARSTKNRQRFEENLQMKSS